MYILLRIFLIINVRIHFAMFLPRTKPHFHTSETYISGCSLQDNNGALDSGGGTERELLKEESEAEGTATVRLLLDLL